MTAGHYVASAARLSAMRVQPPQDEAIKEAYIALCGAMSDRYDQQARRPNTLKWIRANVHSKKWKDGKTVCWRCRQPFARCTTCSGPRCATCKPDCEGTPQPLTREHILDHLAGTATYGAVYADESGITTLLVADDDYGGVERAQRAVDRFNACGIDVCAVARSSLRGDGTPRHNGSKIIMPVAAGVDATEAKRAFKALCQLNGYSTDEVMRRAELPFGRSLWAPANDEYGQLILAGRAPQRITSGMHGMQLLMAANLNPVDPDYLLSFAPPKPEPTTPKPASTPYRGGALHNCDKDVVAAFNAHNTARDVLEWQSWRQIGPVNFRCGCASHPNGDRTPSIGLNSEGTLAYFNAPACRYHNQGRPYTAFSLWQHLAHQGDYKATVSAARYLLNMPFTPQRQDTPKDEPPARLAPAAVETHEPVTIARILEEIARRLETIKLRLSDLDTLRAIARLCKAANGAAAASWETIAELAGWSVATVRRRVDRLAALGFIAKHANGNETGGWAPNVFEVLPQPTLWMDAGEPVETVDHSPVSDLNNLYIPIKEEESIGEICDTTPVQIDTTPLFNSPRIKIELEWFEEFKRKHPQPARINRYLAAAGLARLPRQLPTITRSLSYAEIDEMFYGGTKGDWYADASAAERKATGKAYRLIPGTYDPSVEPMNNLPDPDMGAQIRAHAARKQMAARLTEMAQAPASPPLIAPAPHPTPADTGHNAPSLEAQMDAAAARGDRAGLLALLDRLGAWDRALANAKYDAVLCKFNRAGRAA